MVVVNTDPENRPPILLLPTILPNPLVVQIAVEKDLGFKGVDSVTQVDDNRANWRVKFKDGFEMIVSITPISLFFPINMNEDAAVVPHILDAKKKGHIQS